MDSDAIHVGPVRKRQLEYRRRRLSRGLLIDLRSDCHYPLCNAITKYITMHQVHAALRPRALSIRRGGGPRTRLARCKLLGSTRTTSKSRWISSQSRLGSTLSAIAVLGHIPLERSLLAIFYLLVSGWDVPHVLRVFYDFALMQSMIREEVDGASRLRLKQGVGTQDAVQSHHDVQQPGEGNEEDTEDLEYPAHPGTGRQKASSDGSSSCRARCQSAAHLNIFDGSCSPN